MGPHSETRPVGFGSVLGFVLLILWPVIEIFVAIKVAEAIGAGLMLLALLASSPIGYLAVRSQGRGVLRRLAGAAARQRAPAHEALNGALILVGGALMILPGFITDAIGLVLLFPPTRALARGALVRRTRSALYLRAVRFGAGREPYDVESTARDLPPPTLPA